MATSLTKKNKVEDIGFNNQDLRVVQLESMRGCKHPPIDSGATPIGSAGRAPDKDELLVSRDQDLPTIMDVRQKTILVPARSFFGQSLGGY